MCHRVRAKKKGNIGGGGVKERREEKKRSRATQLNKKKKEQKKFFSGPFFFSSYSREIPTMSVLFNRSVLSRLYVSRAKELFAGLAQSFPKQSTFQERRDTLQQALNGPVGSNTTDQTFLSEITAEEAVESLRMLQDGDIAGYLASESWCLPKWIGGQEFYQTFDQQSQNSVLASVNAVLRLVAAERILTRDFALLGPAVQNILAKSFDSTSGKLDRSKLFTHLLKDKGISAVLGQIVEDESLLEKLLDVVPVLIKSWVPPAAQAAPKSRQRSNSKKLKGNKKKKDGKQETRSRARRASGLDKICDRVVEWVRQQIKEQKEESEEKSQGQKNSSPAPAEDQQGAEGPGGGDSSNGQFFRPDSSIFDSIVSANGDIGKEKCDSMLHHVTKLMGSQLTVDSVLETLETCLGEFNQGLPTEQQVQLDFKSIRTLAAKLTRGESFDPLEIVSNLTSNGMTSAEQKAVLEFVNMGKELFEQLFAGKDKTSPFQENKNILHSLAAGSK